MFNAYKVSPDTHDDTPAISLPTAGHFNMGLDDDSKRLNPNHRAGDAEVGVWCRLHPLLAEMTRQLTEPPQAGLEGNFVKREWIGDVFRALNYTLPPNKRPSIMAMWKFVEHELKRQTRDAIAEEQNLSSMLEKLTDIIKGLQKINAYREQDSRDKRETLNPEYSGSKKNRERYERHQFMQKIIFDVECVATALAAELEEVMAERVLRKMLDEILTDVVKDTLQGAARGTPAVTEPERVAQRAAQGSQALPPVAPRGRNLQVQVTARPLPAPWGLPSSRWLQSPRSSPSPRLSTSPRSRLGTRTTPQHSPSAMTPPHSAGSTPTAAG